MAAAELFDFVFGDAFDDVEVPHHLTIRQFNDLVARHLKPDGFYLAFPYVGLMAQRVDWPRVRGQRRTFVLVAAKRVPPQALPVVPAREVDEFAHGHSVVLTDDFARVDLLAPVFAQKLNTRR